MESYPVVLSVEQQVRSQRSLEFWIHSVLRQTAVWGIQSQLEETCNEKSGKKTLSFKSVGAVQEICQRTADIWASKVRLRGLTTVADTIQTVTARGRDDLYLGTVYCLAASPGGIPRANIEASSEKIDNPAYRWPLLYNLERGNAHETLDRLLMGSPFHNAMVQQQSQRPGRLSIAVPTNASEEVIIRKRKSYHLKLRTVQEPRPMGRPRKPRSKSNRTPPRPPIDPEQVLSHASLNDAEKKDMDETMIHGKIEDCDSRLIAAIQSHPRGLPTHLQAPAILELKDRIYLLPMVKLKYNDDPTTDTT